MSSLSSQRTEILCPHPVYDHKLLFSRNRMWQFKFNSDVKVAYLPISLYSCDHQLKDHSNRDQAVHCCTVESWHGESRRTWSISSQHVIKTATITGSVSLLAAACSLTVSHSHGGVVPSRMVIISEPLSIRFTIFKVLSTAEIFLTPFLCFSVQIFVSCFCIFSPRVQKELSLPSAPPAHLRSCMLPPDSPASPPHPLLPLKTPPWKNPLNLIPSLWSLHFGSR